mgnify:CR=1 FL=1
MHPAFWGMGIPDIPFVNLYQSWREKQIKLMRFVLSKVDGMASHGVLAVPYEIERMY